MPKLADMWLNPEHVTALVKNGPYVDVYLTGGAIVPVENVTVDEVGEALMRASVEYTKKVRKELE